MSHVQRLLAEGQRVAGGGDREAALGRLLDRDFDVELIRARRSDPPTAG